MSDPNPHRNTDSQAERFDDPDSPRYLGVTTRGYDMYYDQDEHVSGTGEPDAEGPIRLKDRTPLGDDTSLGEFISDIEEQIGWDELSPFAETHRDGEGDEATGRGNADESEEATGDR